MTKNLGLAGFSARGPMEYVLESGQWLQDIELYGGAPVLLFEHKDATPSINAWLLTGWHSMWIARARSLPIPERRSVFRLN
ncbi:hypothetical protein ACJJWD_17590 [Comamonas testosteroni]|uniref:hypothetical protein n=1 Tax=Comamonas testosteroni TaxID=285 RepID=UPI00389ADF6F